MIVGSSICLSPRSSLASEACGAFFSTTELMLLLQGRNPHDTAAPSLAAECVDRPPKHAAYAESRKHITIRATQQIALVDRELLLQPCDLLLCRDVVDH